ncbi:hypothetical protein SAMN05216205_2708 [Pseudomonas mohnii]|jgi:hypothetical protein|uniref:Uncharacterized protein n=1 Tax=Pseudomonas mohnii TaxID=395600 RepID=A0ABY0XYX4_9PSED|nr:hypothetical protein SAMN05216205_2708 [Pseudomonas mohnii]
MRGAKCAILGVLPQPLKVVANGDPAASITAKAVDIR